MRMVLVAAGWAWAAAIVWLSLTPAPPQVDISHADKLGHLGAYGLLMFWFSGLYLQTRTRAAYAAGFVAMGIALELLQGQLGYRSHELLDMLANTLGVLAGWAAALVLARARTA